MDPKQTLSSEKNEFDDYAHEADRPSNVLLGFIKSVINDSPAMMKETKALHPIYFSRANTSLTELTKAFDEVEKLVIGTEADRAIFVPDHRKVGDRDHYRDEASYISDSMQKLRNGDTVHSYQKSLAEVDTKLREIHKQQEAKTAEARKIKQAENDKAKNTLRVARDVDNKALLDAQAILDALEAQIDKLPCCFKSKKDELLKSFQQQQEKVATLDRKVREDDRKIAAAPIAMIEDVQPTEEEIKLQKDHDLYALLIKDCVENRDAILKQKQNDLNDLNLDVSTIERGLRQDAQRHYMNVSATIMHGLVRLYARYHEFKDAFDVGVVQYKPDFASMRKEIDLEKLERLADQIRSDEFGGQNIKQIYDQFTALDQAKKDKLLKQLPDNTTLKQVFGIPKVSQIGMFNAAEQKAKTKDRRQHFERQDKVKNFKG
jgi:hypothetical protein